jgi:tetratricopeptide (TPR) repeat protein
VPKLGVGMTLSTSEPKPHETGASRTIPRVVLELVVILCLTVCYYSLVRNFALGVGINYTNPTVFTACAPPVYHLNGLYDVWKGRLSGLLLAGQMFNWAVQSDGYSIERSAMLFGLYHAGWLLVLLLVMLAAVRQSLLVNLAIFAGLLFNFAPSAGFYFYPWDLPATVFLTLAVLLHERGHRVLMLLAIGVGCFFKETVLVGAVLCMFDQGWKWRWRLLSFAGLLAFYIAGKHCLIGSLHLKTAVLAMGDSTQVAQLVRADYLLRNFKLLFSDQAGQVLFANGGTLVAVLVLGWERRFRPYLWMMVAYVAGQFLYGEFNEVRIFMQVLPVSCLILSEYAPVWPRYSANAVALSSSGSSPEPRDRKQKKHRVKTPKPAAAGSAPTSGAGAWAYRQSDRALVWLAVTVMAISSATVIWDYGVLLMRRQPGYRARELSELRLKAEQGNAAAQYAVGNHYYRGLGTATNWVEAFYWYKQAAENGHTGARLTLGLRYLLGEGTEKNIPASIPWFRKVAAQADEKMRCYFELIYGEGFGAKPERFAHFQYLAWLGPLALAAAGIIVVAGRIRKRKPWLDPALGMVIVLMAGALSWRWRYGGVERLWQSTVARDPNCYLARKNLGYALVQTGKLDEGLACLQRVVDSEPDDGAVHFNLANGLFQKERFDEAIVHYRKAIELRPDNPNVHNNLGYALARQGKWDEAVREYQEALRLKPGFTEASNNLAGALKSREAALPPPGPASPP